MGLGGSGDDSTAGSRNTGPQSRFLGYLDCLNPCLRRKSPFGVVQEARDWGNSENAGRVERWMHAERQSCDVFPGSRRVFFDVSQDQLILEFAEQSLRLSDLSDGYRNMLAMTADIAIRCATLNPALEAEAVLATPGVVLIDEIDLHLHPKWQRRVVDGPATDFPAHSVCRNDSFPVRDSIASRREMTSCF